MSFISCNKFLISSVHALGGGNYIYRVHNLPIVNIRMSCVGMYYYCCCFSLPLYLVLSLVVVVVVVGYRLVLHLRLFPRSSGAQTISASPWDPRH